MYLFSASKAVERIQLKLKNRQMQSFENVKSYLCCSVYNGNVIKDYNPNYSGCSQTSQLLTTIINNKYLYGTITWHGALQRLKTI